MDARVGPGVFCHHVINMDQLEFLIMHRILIGILVWACFAHAAQAQTQASLNTFSDSDVIVKRLNCPAGTVQFARGVRWAPANNAVSLTINDVDEVLLPPSCYAQMYCARYRGDSSVVIVDTPACGGSALAPEYIVIDLISKKKVVLNQAQLKANVR